VESLGESGGESGVERCLSARLNSQRVDAENVRHETLEIKAFLTYNGI
jgi:hypothetical protein